MPAGENPTSGVEILVDGTKLPQELMSQLLEIRVRDDLFKPDTAVLRLRDPQGTLVDDERLTVGRKFAVKTSKATETVVKPLFEGEIVALEPEFLEHDCIVAVRAYDKSHRLHGKRTSRSFQNMTASDMVKKVGQEAGLGAGTVKATSIVHKFFQQSMETDWEFCWRLAVMNNLEFVVEGDRFHFRDRSATVGAEVEWGATLLAFRPRMSGIGQPKDVSVANFDPVNKRTVNGRATAPAAAVKNEATNGRAAVVSALSGGSVVVADRVVENQSEASRLAQHTLDRIASTFMEAEGKAVGDPAIRAGSRLKIAKVGKRFSGEYVLTQTTHVVRGGDPYVTSFAVSGRAGHGFADLLRPAQGPDWSNQLVVGLVTNNKDPEGMGRVRVKFPALDDTLEGWWARVATINAGPSRGLFMLPEINDEVVVAFEHGDTRRPIVIGSVYGGKDKPPPEVLDGKNNPPKAAFGMKSDDKAHLESRMELKLVSDEKMTVDVRKGAPGGTGDLAITSAGSVDTKAQQNVRTTAQGQVQVEAQSSVTIKGTGSVTVETSGALKLKGSVVDIQSTGPVNVKGAVINLG